MVHEFNIDTDHFQVLIGDRIRGPLVDTTHLWDVSNHLAMLPDVPEIIGLATARYGGRTRLQVEVTSLNVEAKPNWTLLGKFYLKILSGEIIFWGPETSELDRSPTLAVIPGMYEGLAFSRGTDTVIDDLASEGADEYYIALRRITL